MEKTIYNTCGICGEPIKEKCGRFSVLAFEISNKKNIPKNFLIDSFSLHSSIPSSHLKCKIILSEILTEIAFLPIKEYNDTISLFNKEEKLNELISKLKEGNIFSLTIENSIYWPEEPKKGSGCYHILKRKQEEIKNL